MTRGGAQAADTFPESTPPSDTPSTAPGPADVVEPHLILGEN